MAKNQTDTLTAATWTQLTNANVSAITFENLTRAGLYVIATVGANAPAAGDLSGAAFYPPGQGEKNVSLADLFPGVSGANRLYGLVEEAGKVFVSHV